MLKRIGVVFVVVLLLGAALVGCSIPPPGDGDYECVDDALIIPEGDRPKPPSSRTGGSSTRRQGSNTGRPKTYKTKSAKPGKGWHWDSDDCEWERD